MILGILHLENKYNLAHLIILDLHFWFLTYIYVIEINGNI